MEKAKSARGSDFDPAYPAMNPQKDFREEPRLRDTVLVVEDEENLRESLRGVLEKIHCKVVDVGSGEEAVRFVRNQSVSLVLLDIRLPGIDGLEVLQRIRESDEDALVIMMTAFPEAQTAVSAMKNGAYDYINKPFELDELRFLVQKALETRHLKDEVDRLRRMEGSRGAGATLLGECSAIRDVRELIRVVSRTPDTTVLIQGESGTGKEIVARAIHTLSDRRGRAMMNLNCGGVPETLLESELFGYEKGAFTGARKAKKGLVELADGGTLFLDEVGNMSPVIQPKLLRLLEDCSFRRLGGTREISVNLRVISATNRDLREMVAAGEFREDLYYRLNVMNITLPPLRERGEDISILARFFLARHGSRMGKEVREIPPATQKMLLRYPWPGNVRELSNVMERAVILARGSTLLPQYLPIDVQQNQTAPGAIPREWDLREADLSLESVEEAHIRRVLRIVDHNKSEASRRLGISRSTLNEKLKKIRL